VTLTSQLHQQILAILRYDKRDAGVRGRALVRDVPEALLRAGDRLEPSPELPDIGEYENIVKFPMTLVFWRSARDSLVLHRNPLWDSAVGITPTRSLTVDALHTMHLGVMQAWAKVVSWLLLDNGHWAPFATTQDERNSVGATRMRHELAAFCKKHKENLQYPNDFTMKMLGTRADPKMKLSGAETWSYLLFCIWCLEVHAEGLGQPGSALREAGECLKQIHEMSRADTGVVAATQQQARLSVAHTGNPNRSARTSM